MGPEREEENGLRPTGWRMPLGVALATAAIVFLVTDRLYSDLPLLPWTAIPTLLLLAVAEFIAAYHTRRRIRRLPGTEPIEPLSVARLVALAKASAVLAALTIGGFGGVVLALLDRLHAPGPRADALTAAGSMLAAGVLLAAALLLEHACRVPEEENGE